MDIQKEIKRQTREYGFDKAVYWLKWEGYDVYILTFDGQELGSDNLRPAMGPPFLLLVNDNEVRLAGDFEWPDILVSAPDE